MTRQFMYFCDHCNRQIEDSEQRYEVTNDRGQPIYDFCSDCVMEVMDPLVERGRLMSYQPRDQRA